METEKKPVKTELERKIDLWKKQYGGVFQITVKDKEGKEYYAYLRKANRLAVMSYYSMVTHDRMKAMESLYKQLVLEADPEISSNELLEVYAYAEAPGVIEVFETSIKNL